MASTRSVKIAMTVKCDCGKNFIAEDCEPICPYCEREYQVSIFAGPKKLKVDISPVCKQSEKVQLITPEISQNPTIHQ